MPAGSPNPLKVWEVATRRLIRRLNGHTGYCVSLDFSRDGTLLASGSRDGTAIIWSTETWKATQTLQNPDRGRWTHRCTVGHGRGCGLFAGRQDPGHGQLWRERAVVGRRHRKTSGNAQGAFQCGPRRGVFAGWSHPGVRRQ